MCFASCPFFPESSAVRTPVLHVCIFSCFPLFFFEICFVLRFEIQPTPLHKTEKNDSQEYLGQCFSFCFVVSSNYFVFWPRKLLSATKATKNRKTSKKTKKTKDSEECLGQGLCSEALATKKSTTTFFW